MIQWIRALLHKPENTNFVPETQVKSYHLFNGVVYLKSSSPITRQGVVTESGKC